MLQGYSTTIHNVTKTIHNWILYILRELHVLLVISLDTSPEQKNSQTWVLVVYQSYMHITINAGAYGICQFPGKQWDEGLMTKYKFTRII